VRELALELVLRHQSTDKERPQPPDALLNLLEGAWQCPYTTVYLLLGLPRIRHDRLGARRNTRPIAEVPPHGVERLGKLSALDGLVGRSTRCLPTGARRELIWLGAVRSAAGLTPTPFYVRPNTEYFDLAALVVQCLMSVAGRIQLLSGVSLSTADRETALDVDPQLGHGFRSSAGRLPGSGSKRPQ
jgi:hypothetical protein